MLECPKMHQKLFCRNLFIWTITLVSLLLIFAVTSTHAHEGRCGTMRLFEELIKEKKQPHIYARKNSDYNLDSSSICTSKDYYDSVYTIETPHFQVMYALIGPHATTQAFADSTAAIFEEAWDFYVNKLKMRKPKAPSTSLHFQKNVKEGLYPIEIIDINQNRDNILRVKDCVENFGITYPVDDKSQIFIENDFFSTCSNVNQPDSIIAHGVTCLYTKPTYPMQNYIHNFSYSEKWNKGLRVTIFHEFYHALQLSYISFYTNESFWFEASAAGFEEITTPDVDDYMRYIPSFFSRMGMPLSDTFDNYGAGTLLIYLYNHVSKDIDRHIWESYAKNPNKDFEYQLENALKPFNLDADSIFHDYSVRLAFSGNRAANIKKKDWINNDQSQWFTPYYYVRESIKPQIDKIAFEFFQVPHSFDGYYSIDFSDFIGKASIVAYRNGEAKIHKIQNTKTLDSLTALLATSDSSTWIFSRLGKSESIPITNSNAAPHAFPVPWKQGPLCFAPLPRDQKVFEIRTRRGDLITQEKYDGNSFCLQEDQVKSMMAPGIYRFRVGNKGKTTSFIVVY